LQVRGADGTIDPKVIGRTRITQTSFSKLRAVQVPSLVWASMQSTRGSLSHRFDGMLTGIEETRKKHRKLGREAEARQEAIEMERQERLRQRRLEESAIGAKPSELYDRLDKAATDGRRLQQGGPANTVAELPESHALTWMHDVVGGAEGWRNGFSELRRLAGVERERQAMRESGLHSHDHIAARHPTGYAKMDYYSPSILGDAIRRLHSRKTTGEDPKWWPKTSWVQSGRRMSEQEAQEAGAPSGYIRRLSTALFQSTLAAPYAFRETILPSGTVVSETSETVWQNALRYTVYSTVGCYFTAPVNEAVQTQGGTAGNDGDASHGVDGDTIRVLRPSAEKLCFPAVSLRTLSIP
jgi:hypothetical protein